MFHSINNEQKLFILKSGNGFSCLGFDFCDRRNRAIRKEMNLPAPDAEIGTEEQYKEYQEAVRIASESGKRLVCELHPRLIGLEGKSIEANIYGTRKRFTVGKSTGFIPCHLAIMNSCSRGGYGIGETDDLGEIKIIK